MHIKLDCDDCGVEVERAKYLKRVNGKRFCKDCYRKNRKKHREETIESEGIGEELKRLENKSSSESARRSRERRKIEMIPTLPKIKGSKINKKKKRSSSFLSTDERQNLFRMLVGRGIDIDEVKERINNLMDEQRRVREIMKEKNKSEDEIKLRQQEMLEELWNY